MLPTESTLGPSSCGDGALEAVGGWPGMFPDSPGACIDALRVSRLGSMCPNDIADSCLLLIFPQNGRPPYFHANLDFEPTESAAVRVVGVAVGIGGVILIAPG